MEASTSTIKEKNSEHNPCYEWNSNLQPQLSSALGGGVTGVGRNGMSSQTFDFVQMVQCETGHRSMEDSLLFH
jgi:hypothetical protein